jgi:hypothetical protein
MAIIIHSVLKRIFVTRGQEAAGCWRRLNTEELYNLYTQQYIIRKIKSRTVRIGGTCSTHGRDDIHKKFLRSENLKTREHFEDLGLNGEQK